MSETLSIGRVAERSGLKVTALRFYEDRGLINSHRNDGNQRRYKRDVLRRLAVIAAAQHVGFTLNEISEMLSDLPAGNSSDEVGWQSIASSWRPHLDDRIETLERLRDQLDTCIGCGCLSLPRCQLVNVGDRLASHGPGAVAWKHKPPQVRTARREQQT